jgi:hypothetical protein
MDPQHDASPPDEPPPIRGRADTGGPWSVAWPLAALALIGLLTLRACVPALPSAPAAPAATTAPAGR